MDYELIAEMRDGVGAVGFAATHALRVTIDEHDPQRNAYARAASEAIRNAASYRHDKAAARGVDVSDLASQPLRLHVTDPDVARDLQRRVDVLSAKARRTIDNGAELSDLERAIRHFPEVRAVTSRCDDETAQFVAEAFEQHLKYGVRHHGLSKDDPFATVNAATQFAKHTDGVLVYTDGSYIPSTGRVGWAWVSPDGRCHSGAADGRSSGVAELLAIEHALADHPGCVVVALVDSAEAAVAVHDGNPSPAGQAFRDRIGDDRARACAFRIPSKFGMNKRADQLARNAATRDAFVDRRVRLLSN